MKKTHYIILMATLCLSPTLSFALEGSISTHYVSSNPSQYLCQSDSLYPAYGIVIAIPPGSREIDNITPYSLIASWGSGEHTFTYYAFTAPTAPSNCGPAGSEDKILGTITFSIAPDHQTANVIESHSTSSMTFQPSEPTNNVSKIKVSYSDATKTEK